MRPGEQPRAKRLEDIVGSPAAQARLLGFDQLLFATCVDAMRTSSTDDLDANLRSWLDELRDHRHGGAQTVASANAVVDLTRALIPGAETDLLDVTRHAAEAWSAAHVLTDRGPVGPPARAFIPDTIGRASQLLHLLAAQDQQSAADGTAALVVAALGGFLPEDRVSAVTPVVFDRHSLGESATLRLSLVPHGPVGLYPDPRTMSLFRGDAGFAESLSAAWEAAPGDLDERCVMWSIHTASRPCDHVVDRSLGGAFAVGLHELSHRVRPLVRRLRWRTLDPRCAVSAVLVADRQLGPIGPPKNKLNAARDAGLRVVLPKASQQDVEDLRLVDRYDISYAVTVDDAIREVRSRPSRTVWVLAAAAIVALASAIAVVHQRAVSARQERTEAYLRKADELRDVAAGTGDRSVRDYSLQTLLLLAGSDLARDAGDDELADEMLADVTRMTSGTRGVLPVDIGRVSYLHSAEAGRALIAGSTDGHVTFLRAATNEQLGTMVEPPGIESLGQRRIRAAAEHPSIDVFAAALQAGDDDPQHLVVFGHQARQTPSGPLPLAEVGRLEVPGAAPVRALLYKPTGEMLMGATGDELIVWNVFNSQPSEAARCSLGVEPAEPVELFLEPDNSAPVVLFADGRLVRVEDAWPPVLANPRPSPCVLTELLPPSGSSLSASARVDDSVLVAGAAPEVGEVAVRSTAGGNARTVTLAEGPPVVALLLRSDGQKLVVARDGLDTEDPRVETYDVATGDLDATFEGYTAPLASTVDGVLAVERRRHRVTALATEGWVGFRGVAPSHPDAVRVAAGRDAFAATSVSGSRIDILPLVEDRHASSILLPFGWEVASLPWTPFDISTDGTLVAAILQNTTADPPTRVSVWDVRTGTEVELPDLGEVTDVYENRPIGVRFLPGSRSLVVAYIRGDIVRLDRRDGARNWRPTVLREGAVTHSLLALEVTRDRVYALDFEPNLGATASNNWLQTVVSISAQAGEPIGEWDVTDLSLRLGPPDGESRLGWVMPLAGGEAMLMTGTGDIYRLASDGRVDSEGLALDVGEVSSSAEIPGTKSVVLAGRNGTVVVDTEGQFRRRPGESLYGPASNVDVSTDGRFLIGAAPQYGLVSIVPLRPEGQRAGLCAAAGRELTRLEWSSYVGSVAPYRELCSEAAGVRADIGHAASEIAYVEFAATLRNSDTGQQQALADSCDASRRSRAVVASSSGGLSWAMASDGNLAPDVMAVVCVDNAVRWVLPATTPGGFALDSQHVELIPGTDEEGNPVLGVALHLPDQDGGAPILQVDVVSANGLLASTVVRRGNVTRPLTERMSVGYEIDAIDVDQTFGPVGDSPRWESLSQHPAGWAGWGVMPVVEDPTPVLGGPSPAFASNPFNARGVLRVAAAVGDATKVGVIADEHGPIATAVFVRSDGNDRYDLLAWRSDNRLVCDPAAELLGEGLAAVVAADAGLHAKARCDLPSQGFVLTGDGIGPLQIGMSVEDARATGLLSLNVPVDEGASWPACALATTRFPVPGELTALFADGKLAALTVHDGLVPTESGIRVGNSRPELVHVLGDATKSDSLDLEYEDDGSTLIFRMDYRDVEQARIREIHAGDPRAGCSSI